MAGRRPSADQVNEVFIKIGLKMKLSTIVLSNNSVYILLTFCFQKNETKEKPKDSKSTDKPSVTTPEILEEPAETPNLDKEKTADHHDDDNHQQNDDKEPSSSLSNMKYVCLSLYLPASLHFSIACLLRFVKE